jgi:hypothetical protein
VRQRIVQQTRVWCNIINYMYYFLFSLLYVRLGRHLVETWLVDVNFTVGCNSHVSMRLKCVVNGARAILL